MSNHESLPKLQETFQDFEDQAAAERFISQSTANGLEVTRSYDGPCVYGVRVFYLMPDCEVEA